MKTELRDKIISACSAEHIPEQERGRWSITKGPYDLWGRLALKYTYQQTHTTCLWKKAGFLPPEYGVKTRKMDGKILGELVMHDQLDEILKHMIFMLRARGDVLISGLGLGCVARGCLANPAVKSVTILERDANVLQMVVPHFLQTGIVYTNFEIVECEAEAWIKKTRRRFTCAWHDLQSDANLGDPKLAVKHASLISAGFDKVRDFQGAWDFPRASRRAWARSGLKVI